MARIIVAGGGPAGMLAAYRAAAYGHRVTLLEQNDRPGRKLRITGKGRCNLTNACETEDLFAHIAHGEKFLYSAFYSFDNYAVMKLFEENGLPLKTERGMRVFPVSDRAEDVVTACVRMLKESGVRIVCNAALTDLLLEQAAADDGCDDGRYKIHGVVRRDPNTGKTQREEADALILATGGVSYPGTGANDSGLRICEKYGHLVTDLRPSLVPFSVKEKYLKSLSGLSLKNVNLVLYNGKRKVYSGFGEMLFAHFGITGPLVLTASASVPDACFAQELAFAIDLKPALSKEQLNRRILRDFEENQNRQFKNALDKLLPAKLIPVMVELSGIDPAKKVHSVTRAERARLVELCKGFPGTVTGLRGFDEAVVTRGGVCTKEVDPSTMESKKIQGLYLCGEMLDCDALTGGFNLQIAWSTGWLAGESAGSAFAKEGYAKET